MIETTLAPFSYSDLTLYTHCCLNSIKVAVATFRRDDMVANDKNYPG